MLRLLFYAIFTITLTSSLIPQSAIKTPKIHRHLLSSSDESSDSDSAIKLTPAPTADSDSNTNSDSDSDGTLVTESASDDTDSDTDDDDSDSDSTDTDSDTDDTDGVTFDDTDTDTDSDSESDANSDDDTDSDDDDDGTTTSSPSSGTGTGTATTSGTATTTDTSATTTAQSVTPRPTSPPTTPAPTVNPTTAEPTATTAVPTSSPTRVLIEADLQCDDETEGDFSLYGVQQIAFVLDASSSGFSNTLLTLNASGVNLTVTEDSSGTVLLVLNEGETGTMTASEDLNYTVVVWQTDTAVDEWTVYLWCSSAAPTSEPTTAARSSAEPTAEPTIAPTYDVCTTNDSLNIAIIMDESSSVSEEEWEVMSDFVERITTYDIAGPSYVGLWEYAALVAFKNFLWFTEIGDDRDGVSDVSDALDTNSYNTPGTTYTWDAVNRVMDAFYNYRNNCTDGCEYRSDLLILFTDGAPTDTVCPDMYDRVNQSWIDIVVIAIGETEDEVDAWVDEVTCLDYNDDYVDILKVTSFTDAGFNALEGLIRNKTCNGENGELDEAYYGEQWVYDDGNTSLGPVPTASGGGNAPSDPSSALQAVRSVIEGDIKREEIGYSENIEISLSPFATFNLWALSLSLIAVIVVMVVRCVRIRTESDYGTEYEVERQFAIMDQGCMPDAVTL